MPEGRGITAMDGKKNVLIQRKTIFFLNIFTF